MLRLFAPDHFTKWAGLMQQPGHWLVWWADEQMLVRWYQRWSDLDPVLLTWRIEE